MGVPWDWKVPEHILFLNVISNLPKYLANFPNFTDIPAHSLVK